MKINRTQRNIAKRAVSGKEKKNEAHTVQISRNKMNHLSLVYLLLYAIWNIFVDFLTDEFYGCHFIWKILGYCSLPREWIVLLQQRRLSWPIVCFMRPTRDRREHYILLTHFFYLYKVNVFICILKENTILVFSLYL